MSRHGRNVLVILLWLLSIPWVSYAGTWVGKRAASYIGGLRERLTGSEYYAVVLERRNEERLTGNRIDAVIFSPFARTFKVIRRLDEDHALTLNVTDGNSGAKVTAGNIDFYQQMIKENAMQPEVFFDKNGSELLIAYCGLSPCRVICRKETDGRLNLEVRKFLLPPEPDVLLPLPPHELAR